MDNLIRSVRGGCYAVYTSKAWGRCLLVCDDPQGVKLTKFEKDGIQLNPDFPVVPAELWSRVIGLYFYMCPESKKSKNPELEVQVCFLRDTETLTKWKIVVPHQKVSGTSVNANLSNSIDIATGEEYSQFPPPGWVHAGSSHSHNTMSAFFSSTDDKNELTVPGLHIVVGSINHKKSEYAYKASVVLRKERKEVPSLESVVDVSPIGLEFHSDVLKYIKVEARRSTTFVGGPGAPLSTAAFWTKKQQNTKKQKQKEMLFFDEEGKPDAFLFGLNKSNCDLFDDIEDSDFADFQQKLISGDDTKELIEDQISSGIDIEEILQAMKAANLDMGGK